MPGGFTFGVMGCGLLSFPSGFSNLMIFFSSKLGRKATHPSHFPRSGDFSKAAAG